MDHLKRRGQDDVTGGLGDISQYAGATMPTDFEIESVLDDIIMAKFDDVSEDGQDIVRDGIFLNTGTTKECWRSAVVLKVGPECSSLVKEGTRIGFPNDKGVLGVQLGSAGQKEHIVFLNESRMFAILKSKPEEV